MNERSELVELVTPDTIKVRVEHSEEVVAIGADVYITVRGSSFFTGEMALTKAREVSQLVTELKTMGIPDTAMHLEGVSAKVSSGVLGKSSSARYMMRVACSELEKLPDALGIITAQKSTEITHILWRLSGDYDSDESVNRNIELCVERAHVRAKVIANGLDVQLQGVHRFSCSGPYRSSYINLTHGGYDHASYAMRESMAQYACSDSIERDTRMTGSDLSIEISHRERVSFAVDVEYLISRYTPSSAA